MSNQLPDNSGAQLQDLVTAGSADRRSFLLSIAMYTGLFSAYGFFAALAGRFLFPAAPTRVIVKY